MDDSDFTSLIIGLQHEENIQKYNLYIMWKNQILKLVPTLLTMSATLQHTRMPDYYEDWLPQYLERDFFNLFRMTRDTLLHLLADINRAERQFVGGEQPVSVEKCMLLWWLGKGDTLISISDRFNIAPSTAYNCIEFIIPKVLLLQANNISWPTCEEAANIEHAFREKYGYPGVIRAIDGCNIHFKCPNDQQESYIDKNRNHSIKLQGIVTSKKNFTNVMVGFPGSAHDSRVLQNSTIWTDVEDNGLFRKYFFENYHLIGDKAYPLKKVIDAL